MPRMLAATAGPLLFCSTLVALALRTLLRVERAARGSGEGRADAIVVFGAAAGPNGPCAELELRLDRAATLFRKEYAPKIVCSGGRCGQTSEARAMREALVQSGIPPAAVEIDERGSSTRRTLEGIARRAPDGIERVIAVSSDYHMHRIAAEARRQGVSAIPSPAPTGRLLHSPRARIRCRAREVAASWWYAVA